jgi:hypothetical protein
LQGGPEYVGGTFDCSKNRLTSLIGGPKQVRGQFNCQNNPLVSLEGLPEPTKWTNLNAAQIFVTWSSNLPLLRLVGRYIVRFQHESFEIIAKYAGDPSRSNILACQKELIDAGFEGNASW